MIVMRACVKTRSQLKVKIILHTSAHNSPQFNNQYLICPSALSFMQFLQQITNPLVNVQNIEHLGIWSSCM